MEELDRVTRGYSEHFWRYRVSKSSNSCNVFHRRRIEIKFLPINSTVYFEPGQLYFVSVRLKIFSVRPVEFVNHIARGFFRQLKSAVVSTRGYSEFTYKCIDYTISIVGIAPLAWLFVSLAAQKQKSAQDWNKYQRVQQTISDTTVPVFNRPRVRTPWSECWRLQISAVEKSPAIWFTNSTGRTEKIFKRTDTKYSCPGSK